MDDKQINNNQPVNDTPAENKAADNKPLSAPATNVPTEAADTSPTPTPPHLDISPVPSSNTVTSTAVTPTITPPANVPIITPVDDANHNATALDGTANDKPPKVEPSDNEQAKVANTDFTGKRILLVEDDEGLAEVYTTRLDVEGFKVKRVPNGEDALAATLEFKPDLILLDVMMPKVSGFEVLDILRNTQSTAKIKIIMLTALSQDSDREKAQSLGVDDYLVKSQVVIADVVDRIKAVLSN